MYGLNDFDLENINNKHKIQRQYLDNHYFNTSSGQVKTLLDVSFSANHSKRYYSELINKINEINNIIIADSVEYLPIFITVTLDGYFRDFLKGNFDRYNPLKHEKTIPNNERFGELRDKIKNKEKFTIRDLYKVLNFQLKRFQDCSKYKKISKDGFKAHYIKCVEPHKKDGVPHMHMMLYIPKQYKDSILQAYKDYFPTRQNLKKIPNCEEGQINGFQWKIESAPAYILKYIFKSFIDVENESELDYLQAWYIKHRILRCVTSKSLIPSWVYRKCIPLEKDWFYLTEIKHTGICEWSKEDDYFMFDNLEGRVIEYNQGIYKMYKNDKLIQEFGTKKQNQKVELMVNNQTVQVKYQYADTIKQMQLKRESLKHDNKSSTEYIYIDNEKYYSNENQLVKIDTITPVNKYSDTALFQHYQAILSDIDSYSFQHFGLVKNELIKRNLINDEILSLNDYQKGF